MLSDDRQQESSPKSDQSTERQRILECILQNDGKRIHDICVDIYKERKEKDPAYDPDWDDIVDHARDRLTPDAARDNFLEAQVPIGFRGIRLIENSDDQ